MPAVVILLRPLLPELWYYILTLVVYAVLGFLFVSKVKIRKPQKTGMIIFLAIGVAAVVLLVVRLVLHGFSR